MKSVAAFLLPYCQRLAAIMIVVSSFSLLSSCEKKLPDPIETISALKQIKNLATVEYTVTKVVKANDNLVWYKAGERKILITCEARIKAGIDLDQLTPGDISISGKSVSIHLPQPKILSVNLPPQNIKVAYSEVGFFRDDFTSQERNELVAQAEKQMWAAGKSLGILEQAKLNTQSFLTGFLVQSGFEKVTLTYDKASPAQATRND